MGQNNLIQLLDQILINFYRLLFTKKDFSNEKKHINLTFIIGGQFINNDSNG